MPFLSAADHRFSQAVSDLVYCNPFDPARIDCERRALGKAFRGSEPAWSLRPDDDNERPNVVKITARAEALLESLRGKLIGGEHPSAASLALYEDLAIHTLYYRYYPALKTTIESALAGKRGAERIDYWRAFKETFARYFDLPGVTLPSGHDTAHLLACFFQIRRAFHHIFLFIVGESAPAGRLRVDAWHSIFTHNLRRYYAGLYRHMADYTTLITGESGTGKELVAQAVGRSRYIPFDAAGQRFTEDFAGSFFALNLSALTPTLIESELFGHKRGSFTGAATDRAGWLEVCPPLGTVFLDEIGELDPAIQVKLLRVLQTRTFQRLGETQSRRFEGKIIAATNRDPAELLHNGRCRTDFYYRLCSDMIRTPSLREQLADQPEDVRTLLRFIARRVAGGSADELTAQVEQWIEQHLGRDYAWPGNIRELEQCVRNIVIRGAYHPPQPDRPAIQNDAVNQWLDEVRAASLSAERLLARYCTWTYARTGSYLAAARTLGLDRRTVRRQVDPQWLAALR